MFSWLMRHKKYKKKGFKEKKHDVKQIIEENGFKFESHSTTTADGYILTMHRIPGAKKGAPVVLL